MDQLGELPAQANLGFVYASDALARQLPMVLALLREQTGIAHWTGTLGMALCVTGREFYDEPAIAVLVGAFPEDGFHIFEDATAEAAGEEGSGLAILHANPRNADTPDIIEAYAGSSGRFVVGGITSSQSENLQVADAVCEGAVSGVAFAPQVEVLTAHTQGCTPIGPRHRITAGARNVIGSLDGRPALEVFEEDIGEVLAKDLNRVAGYIFAGLPVPGSDTNDYLVRNLVGIDTGQKLLAIGDYVQEDTEIMFCRRDGNSARQDMLRMLEDLARRADGRAIRGGVYYSCLGRGRHQFGEDSEELRMVQEVLGDFPLVGFFANGEIFHGRLYGYTGVLTLFV
jgi:small ligand-binding sensory domain FIST